MYKVITYAEEYSSIIDEVENFIDLSSACARIESLLSEGHHKVNDLELVQILPYDVELKVNVKKD